MWTCLGVTGFALIFKTEIPGLVSDICCLNFHFADLKANRQNQQEQHSHISISNTNNHDAIATLRFPDFTDYRDFRQIQ